MSMGNKTNQASGSSLAPVARRTWPLALLVLAAGVAFWLGSHSRPNGALLIDAQNLDFGEAWEDSNFSWRVPLRNAGSSEVEVLDCATSCACLSIKPRVFSLLPGETRELSLQLNLALAARPNADNAWPFRALLVPQIKSKSAQDIRWTVKGRVRKLFDVAPTRATFLDGELVRGEPFPSRSVKVTSVLPLVELTARTDRDQAVIHVQGGPKDFHVKISPSPDLVPGPFRFGVELYGKRHGAKLPTKIIPVEGVIHQEVVSLPPVVLCGAVRVGEMVTERISLISRTRTPFAVKTWSTSSSQASVVQVTGNARAYEIRQRVEAHGKQRSLVTFSVILNGGKKLLVPVEVHYYGLAH